RQCKKCKVRIKTYELSTLKVMEILDNFLPVIIVDKISNALGVALDNEESEEDECSDFYFIDGTSSQSTLLDLFDDIDTNYEPRVVKKEITKIIIKFNINSMILWLMLVIMLIKEH